MIFASTSVTEFPTFDGNTTAYNTRTTSVTISSTLILSKTTPSYQSRSIQNSEKELKEVNNPKNMFRVLKKTPRRKTNARQLYKNDAITTNRNPFLSKLRKNRTDDNLKRGPCFNQKIRKMN